MSKQEFDKVFQDRLHGYEAQVPAGLWGQVQSQLPATPGQPRRTAWLFLGGLAVLAIAGVSYLLMSGGDKAQNTPVLKEASSTSVNESPVPDAVTPAATVIPSSKQARLAAASSQEPAESRSGGIDQSERNTPATVASAPVSNALSSFPALSQEKQMSTPLPHDSFEIKESSTTTSGINTQASSKTTSLPILGGRLVTPLPSAQRTLKPTDCYNFGGGLTGAFYLDAYAGPSWQLRSLKSRNEDISDYISGRDSTESLRLSMHAGLRVSYYLPNGVFFRVGAHYTQVNELFDFVNERSSQTIIVLDSIFDGAGNFVRVDTTTTVTTGTRIKRTYNRYHTIDLPLLVGYQIENGDWSYGIQAGPVFNIAFIEKGDLLSPTGVPGSFSDTSDPDYHPVFRDRLGISIYAAGYIQKRIGENLYAFAEPHILHRLQSITLDSYPIDQRQSVVGLALGVRVKL